MIEGDNFYSIKKMFSGFLTPDLKRTLHCFLFACYTGLRYSDINSLKFLHIIEGNYTPTILEVGVASDFFEIENIEVPSPFVTVSNELKKLDAEFAKTKANMILSGN